jgi:sugar lactone lactonase YvrE
VRKVSSNGIITTVAGSGTKGYSGDGGPAVGALLDFPDAVWVDNLGRLYIADSLNERVRKVTPDGTISTVAGIGPVPPGQPYSISGVPATSAGLYSPTALTTDSLGNLYIAQGGMDIISKVSTSGTITTVAGNATRGYAGDGGSALRAELNAPSGVAVDGAGNVYIADTNNARIRKVSPTGIITTVAGTGTQGYGGDGGQAINAEL